MSTKLIRLEDDVLVEVDARHDEVKPISGGAHDELAGRKWDSLKGTLAKISVPFRDTWNELKALDEIKTAEIELSLSFQAEGSIFVAKSKTGGQISVKLTFSRGSASTK